MAKISNTIKVKKNDGKFEDIQISYIQPKYCTAEGLSTTVEGVCAHAEGKGTIAFNYAHAEGEGTIASGTWAHAEGAYTQATKKASHAEGGGTTASGEYSHAEGEETTASGTYSHAEGYKTIADGEASHAEGGGPHYGSIDCFITGTGVAESNGRYEYTITFDNPDLITDDNFRSSLSGAVIQVGAKVSSIRSVTIVINTPTIIETEKPLGSSALNAAQGVVYIGGALGKYSHVEGHQTTASGNYSHAEGGETIASGMRSHTEGYATIAFGVNSHAEGYKTTASGESSHVEGTNCTASGDFSHAEGGGTEASGDFSHAEGGGTAASEDYSHAEGYNTTSSGKYSHAEGYNTTASRETSHAEGYKTTAYGYYAHAEGYSNNQASTIIDLDSVDDDAIIDAWNTNKFTLAFGLASHAEGYNTIASGYTSHTEGYNTIASGYTSHAGGVGTIASGDYQTVIGRYNVADSTSKYAFITGIGGGTKEYRSNAFTVDWDGKGSFASTVGTNGADYAEYFEWEDKNPLKEDRIGYLVSLNKNKIQKAQCNDNILGIISGTAGVLGDNYEWEWKNKYLTDNFGRVLYEEKEQFIDIPIFDKEGNKTIEKKSVGIKKVPKLNPEYNPDEEYISRTDRPEWDIVGLMGKLYLRDDGTCIPGEYAKVGTEPGIATYSETETKLYVMERITDNIIRVFLK